MVDTEARPVLGVGVDEFLRLLDADRLDLADPDVLDLVMLVPFARVTYTDARPTSPASRTGSGTAPAM